MTGRWTARGLAIAVGLVLLWASGGIGAYLLLGSHRTTAARGAARPGESAARVNPALVRLPGVLYLIQDGALYRLQQGRFTTVLKPAGWAQPRALPNGQGLVLVRRDPSGFSDLYRADGAGGTQQLTHDQGQGAVPGKDPGAQLVTQYWAMYPHASPDGTQLYFATDRYKHVRCCPFDITMRVAQMPLAGGTPRFWTVDAVTPGDPHTEDGDYAGGDAEPVPLPNGALLFVRYAYAGNSIGSQLMLLRQARAAPALLTAPQDSCSQPALAPGGGKLAMICSYGKQTTSLEVAAFDGTSLGPRQVVLPGPRRRQRPLPAVVDRDAGDPPLTHPRPSGRGERSGRLGSHTGHRARHTGGPATAGAADRQPGLRRHLPHRLDQLATGPSSPAEDRGRGSASSSTMSGLVVRGVNP